jgi:RNA polymerase sigma-70 factor (ECF subfamily)
LNRKENFAHNPTIHQLKTLSNYMNVISKCLRKVDEQRLVTAFLTRRDERAFRKLYRRYTPEIHQLTRRLLGGDTVDAEEVTQEAWVRAVERLGGFRWQSSFRTWLGAIVVNCCQEQFRRRNRRQNEIDVDGLELAAGRSEHRCERSDLEQAISGLPTVTVKSLCCMISKATRIKKLHNSLGISTGTSKSQLSNARRAIRRSLQMEPKSKGASNV